MSESVNKSKDPNPDSNKKKASLFSKILDHLNTQAGKILLFITTIGGIIAGVQKCINDSGISVKKEEYIITESAFDTKAEAQQRVAQLVNFGYNQKAGFIFIPEYECMSGKDKYQVYVGPYKKKNIALELCRFKEKFKRETYALNLCKENAQRDQINSNSVTCE